MCVVVVLLHVIYIRWYWFECVCASKGAPENEVHFYSHILASPFVVNSEIRQRPSSVSHLFPKTSVSLLIYEYIFLIKILYLQVDLIYWS